MFPKTCSCCKSCKKDFGWGKRKEKNSCGGFIRHVFACKRLIEIVFITRNGIFLQDSFSLKEGVCRKKKIKVKIMARQLDLH